MKIDLVLTACDLSDHYLHLYPSVRRIWKKRFGLDCLLILVANAIPDFISKDCIPSIILFNPIPNISSIFVAQVIRILYPSLLGDKNVLITDVDIFPISYDYFIKSIESIPDDRFVTYRNKYMKQSMMSICYNVAKGTTWKEIVGTEDLTSCIKHWYNSSYNGRKNCDGWFTDQQKLYQLVMKWNTSSHRLVVLQDEKMKFNRLDKRQRKYILENRSRVKTDIKSGIYTDFHCIKPYSKLKNVIDDLVRAIEESGALGG